MRPILEKAYNLVSQNYTHDAIDLLRNFISGQSRAEGQFGSRLQELRREIALHSGTARRLATDGRLGILTGEEIARQTAQLRVALLGFIDDLDHALAHSTIPPPVVTDSIDFTPPEQSRLEKIWGRNTLQSLSWLHKGLTAARAVCRVVTPVGLGTGFIAPSGRIVTNNHVVPDAECATATTVEFNFEEDASGRISKITSYAISPTRDAFFTSEALDCSVLAISEASEAPPLSIWGVLDLGGVWGVGIGIGDHVTIIQHPNGGQKKIALTANETVNIYDHRLHYMTDTLPGSSGAPVFNDNWKVVAIHRAGGDLIKNARGERFFANEGVLFQHILAIPELRQRLTKSPSPMN